MGTKNYKSGDIIANQGDPITQLSVIVRGDVIQHSELGDIKLEAGNIIGIPGAPSMSYICDYQCLETTVVYEFEYKEPTDLLQIFETSNQYSHVFFKGALQQLREAINDYINIKKETTIFIRAARASYSVYEKICLKFEREPKYTELSQLSQRQSIREMPTWKLDYYCALTASDYEKLYTDLRLVAGSILGIGLMFADMNLEVQTIQEEVDKASELLFNIDQEDLLDEFYCILHDDAIEMEDEQEDNAMEAMENLIGFLCSSTRYEATQVRQRVSSYDEAEERAYELSLKKAKARQSLTQEHSNVKEVLAYAEMDEDFKTEFARNLESYKALPDLSSTSDSVRALRKKLMKDFYVIYKEVVQHALLDEFRPLAVDMFLHFGYLDEDLAGEEAIKLTDIEVKIESLCETEQVYTLFTWLKRIYRGDNSPSISELDQSIEASLRNDVKMGYIQADEVEGLSSDPWRKVEYELDHMFLSTSKVSHGRILTFCPILSAHELVAGIDKMLITAERLMDSMERINTVDFSLFYREILFSDEEHGVPREYIHEEYKPDIILLPNTGTRGMMWQATVDGHNDSSARFMVPILSESDTDELMADLCGRYRWEICKKLQGVRWSDITVPSLTSEYSDYLQYYRKNYELSKDMKTKIKSGLTKVKNNYREVFVNDYILWVQYEVQGSIRVNKVARKILFKYCPMAKVYRDNLSENPIYSEAIGYYKITQRRNARHLKMIFDRYKESGGILNERLQKSLDYNEL